MPQLYFHVENPEQFDALMSLLTFIIAVPTLAYGIMTVIEMRQDTHTTRRLFEIQNRPYVGIPAGKIQFQVFVDEGIEKIDILLHIHNYGHLPAIISHIFITGHHNSDVGSTPDEYVVLQTLLTQVIIFPETYLDDTSNENLLSDISPYISEDIFDLGVSIEYRSHVDQEPPYRYTTIRRVNTKNGLVQILRENYE